VQVADPSEWARYDLANPEFFSLVYEDEDCTGYTSIENVPLVRNRRLFVDELYSFSNSLKGTPYSTFCLCGDTLTVVLDEFDDFARPPEILNGANGPELSAKVERISYASSTGPELIRGIRGITKAGDKLVSLSSPSVSIQWVLCYRLWATKNDERRRVLVLFDKRTKGKLRISQHDVYDVQVHSDHDFLRGSMHPHRSNSGLLPDGTKYYIYRFVLFTDGFETSSSLYKKRSAGGIYIMPMGLPSQYRKAPRFIHTLAVSPPAVSAMAVISTFLPNIVQGSTQGFSTYTADGSKAKVFLDLLGVLTDFHEAADGIPAYHHSGIAGCNLCTMRPGTYHCSEAQSCRSTVSRDS